MSWRIRESSSNQINYMTRVSNPGIPNPRIPARIVNPGSQDCRRPNPGISGLAIFLLISTFHLQNDIFGIKKDL